MATTQATAISSVAVQDRFTELGAFADIPKEILDTCEKLLDLLDRPYEEELKNPTSKELGSRKVGSALMSLREAGYSPHEVRKYQKASKRLKKVATAWIRARKAAASSDAEQIWENLERKTNECYKEIETLTTESRQDSLSLSLTSGENLQYEKAVSAGRLWALKTHSIRRLNSITNAASAPSTILADLRDRASGVHRDMENLRDSLNRNNANEGSDRLGDGDKGWFEIFDKQTTSLQTQANQQWETAKEQNASIKGTLERFFVNRPWDNEAKDLSEAIARSLKLLGKIAGLRDDDSSTVYFDSSTHDINRCMRRCKELREKLPTVGGETESGSTTVPSRSQEGA